MKKALFILLILTVITGGYVFAEEAKAERVSYIKPTFILGMTWENIAVSGGNDISENYLSMGIGVNFVHSTGITFGLKQGTILNYKMQGFSGTTKMNMPFWSFGAGYTYDAESFAITGMLAFYSQNTGLDIEATYWINESLGITGILCYYLENNSKEQFTFIGVGLSMRF